VNALDRSTKTQTWNDELRRGGREGAPNRKTKKTLALTTTNAVLYSPPHQKHTTLPTKKPTLNPKKTYTH